MSGGNQLRRTILHRALHRPNLLMGGERELVMFSLMISGGLVATALNLPAFFIGVLVWGLTIGLLRLMAKADPYLSSVYRRHLRYAHFYPARSSAHTE